MTSRPSAFHILARGRRGICLRVSPCLYTLSPSQAVWRGDNSRLVLSSSLTWIPTLPFTHLTGTRWWLPPQVSTNSLFRYRPQPLICWLESRWRNIVASRSVLAPFSRRPLCLSQNGLEPGWRLCHLICQAFPLLLNSSLELPYTFIPGRIPCATHILDNRYLDLKKKIPTNKNCWWISRINFLKTALAEWLSWVKHWLIYQKLAGLIPSQGTCLGCGFDSWLRHIWEATNQCFSPSTPSSFSKIQ